MKILAIAVVAYVMVVVAFESLIGFFQPSNTSTLVLTTFDPDGTPHDRVLARLETDGKTYVAANHWPRAWYHRVLRNPDVQATIGGTKANYRAVPVTGDEHDRVEREHGHGLGFRILTGFPPRYFIRLDPR
jgi:F420H(2)-dependent quinone reductase